MTINHALSEHWRLRPARAADASAIADLIVLAGDARPDFKPRAAACGEPADLAAHRASNHALGFALKHATVIQIFGQAAGVMLGYKAARKSGALWRSQLPCYLRPIIDLERVAPAAFYLNTLAIFPDFQNMGLGRALLRAALRKAAALGCRSVALEAAAENDCALKFYAKAGFEAAAWQSCQFGSLPPYDKDIVLLRRAIDQPAVAPWLRENAEWRRPHTILQ